MSTDLVVAGAYDLEGIADAAAGWAEELGDDFKPEFPKIQFPAGGATVWQDDEGNPLKNLKGIIVGWHKRTALYLENKDIADEGGNFPDAYSRDGKVQIIADGTPEKAERLGIPVPLTNLAQCPYYEWESAHLVGGSGRGKATREYRDVYILLEGYGVVPYLVSLPTMSLKGFDKYAQSTVFKFGALSAVETVIGLTASGTGQEKFGIANFNRGATLDAAQATQAKAYSRGLKTLISTDPFARVDAVEATTTLSRSTVADQIDATRVDRVEDRGAVAVAEAFDATPVAAGAGALDF